VTVTFSLPVGDVEHDVFGVFPLLLRWLWSDLIGGEETYKAWSGIPDLSVFLLHATAAVAVSRVWGFLFLLLY